MYSRTRNTSGGIGSSLTIVTLVAFVSFIGMSLVPSVSAGVRDSVLAIDPTMQWLVDAMLWLILIGAIFMGAGIVAFATDLGGPTKAAASIMIGAVFLITGIVAGIAGMEESEPVTPPIVPKDIEFSVVASALTSAGDGWPAETGVFDDCDAVTGETTAEWQSAEQVKVSANDFVSLETRDKDEGVGGNFLEAQCFKMSHKVKATNAYDVDGDGTVDSFPYYARVISTGPNYYTGENENATRSVITIGTGDYKGSTYIGFYDDGSDWVAAIPRGQDIPNAGITTPTDYVQLGNDDGSSDDTIYFWFIVNNYGPFGYTTSNLEDEWTVVYEIADEQFSVTLKLRTDGANS